MRDTAGEVGTNSKVTYSCGPLHMDEQNQDDQLEPIYNSSVLIQDVTRERWKIEKYGGIGSLEARHDDDDNEATNIKNLSRNYS